jgi:tetratricopeptide (TPR) repeat protein
LHLFNFITESHYSTNIFYNLAYCDCSRFSEGQLGVDHPDVATSLNNLAALYHSQGRYEAAEPLYQQALSLRREILGDRHPSVANSLSNLAALYYNTQRYSEALLSIQLAIQIYEQTLGTDHPTTQNALSWLQLIQNAM